MPMASHNSRIGGAPLTFQLRHLAHVASAACDDSGSRLSPHHIIRMVPYVLGNSCAAATAVSHLVEKKNNPISTS